MLSCFLGQHINNLYFFYFGLYLNCNKIYGRLDRVKKKSRNNDHKQITRNKQNFQGKNEIIKKTIFIESEKRYTRKKPKRHTSITKENRLQKNTLSKQQQTRLSVERRGNGARRQKPGAKRPNSRKDN